MSRIQRTTRTPKGRSQAHRKNALTVESLEQRSLMAILFDPAGTGSVANAVTLGSLDPTAGNALAQGAIFALSDPGTEFTLYFQARIGALLDLNGDPIPLPAGSEYTVLVGFREVVIPPPPPDPDARRPTRRPANVPHAFRFRAGSHPDGQLHPDLLRLHGRRGQPGGYRIR
jgi:hypothetical protein